MRVAIEIVDLGDAVVETKQAAAVAMIVDNMGAYGWF
jgi:hypothetical protein